MTVIQRIAILISLIVLTSCAGYRVRNRTNPFAESNIKHLAIPIFVNHSLYPGVAPVFTAEVTKLLSKYSGLRLSSSQNKDTDAILLGIITSPQQYRSAYQTTATKFTSGELQESIGERAQFYIPTASTYEITIRLVLIKNPTNDEKDLLLSKMGEKVMPNSKILFNNSFIYSGLFNRESKDTLNSDSGGVVNYTKTRRYFQQTVENLADTMARQFEVQVINVF